MIDEDAERTLHNASHDSQASPAYLKGGGEMGSRIRAHDWTPTLGAPDSWPQSLRTVVRLMLTTEHPVFIFWGAHHICLYNDPYRRLIGPEMHPAILGARGRDVWREVWDVIHPQIDTVMSGKGSTWYENQYIPLLRHGALEEAFWTYSYSPIDDETAPNNVGGVLVICAETTQRTLLQRHQAFRLQLEAVLRTQSTPTAIVAASTKLLGEFLQARRCGYGDIEADKQSLTVRSEWTNGRAPRLGPDIQLSEFGHSFVAWHRHGHAIAIEDPCSNTTGQSRESFFTAPKVQSGLASPLVKNGRLVAALYVYQGTQVRWTEQHQALIRDVAERTYEAVELARAAAERDRAIMALRDSEARYRSLVEASAAIVWEIPASGEFATPQPGWSAYTGQTFDELKGWGWLNAVHPDDQDLAAEALGRAFEARANFELRYRLRGRDGEFRPMLIRAVTVKNADGSLRGWIGMHSDSSRSQPPVVQAPADARGAERQPASSFTAT